MTQSVRILLIGLGAILVALLPALADSPLADPPAPTAPEPAAVHVEHELVAVTIVAETVAPRQIAERGRPLPQRRTRREGFVSRARQLIVGDGRYRPEPFPRAGQ